VKIRDRREFVIGGWSESENSKSFRSILFGEYKDGRLVFVHHSGGGYTAKQKAELFSKFRELEIKKCPFVNPGDIDIDTTCHWVKPELIGEFEISNMTTKKGLIRHPAIFKTEKKVEKPKAALPDITAILLEKIQKVRQNRLAAAQGSWEVLDKHVITSEEVFKVEGKTITLTNIERHVWPEITKADLIQYYISISEWILPYLKDRPVGINISLQNPAEGFFIRGMEGRQPKWSTVFKTDRKHKKAGKPDEIEWLVCNDLATLVWIINLNSIDLHPWGSRTISPNRPDYISIDLDPSDDDFSKVIQTALAAKKLFDEYKIKSFVKTSGKTGMHIYLPCSNIEYGNARSIAENICQAIHKSVPAITTTSTSVNSRGNLLYVDPSQNDYADRLAAPYCVRSYKLPAVSTPLDWKEVKAGLDPASFNIQTISDRLAKKRDLWAGLFDKKLAAQNGKLLTQFL
jgi:bifunctional non-homologous end joining protein LigD